MNATIAAIAAKADSFEFAHPKAWAALLAVGGLMLISSGLSAPAARPADKRPGSPYPGLWSY